MQTLTLTTLTQKIGYVVLCLLLETAAKLNGHCVILCDITVAIFPKLLKKKKKCIQKRSMRNPLIPGWFNKTENQNQDIYTHFLHHRFVLYLPSSPSLTDMNAKKKKKKRKKFNINVQVFQPLCIRGSSGCCIVFLLCPDMWGATGRMEDVMACVTLDEAIGKTGQGYQTVSVFGEEAWCFRVLSVRRFEKCAWCLPVGFLCHLTAEQSSRGRRSLVMHCV